MKDDFSEERKEFEQWIPLQIKGAGKLLGKNKNNEYSEQLINAIFIGFVAGYNCK